MNRSQRLLLLIAAIAFTVYLAFRLNDVASVIDLRDYRTYYSAAKAFVAGDNPYDLAVLSRHAGKEVGYAFFYPKYSLVLFAPLTLFEYQTSAIVYILLKMLALLALVYVWVRFFLPDLLSSLLLCVFLVSGFNGTLVRDFVVGNVSAFEQLFFWLGIISLFRGKLAWFYPLVIASALFKPTTGIFLLLPLGFRQDKKVAFSVVVSVVLLSLYHLGSYLGQEQIFYDRMSNMLWERSHLNPSSFAVLGDGLRWLGMPWHESIRITPALAAVYSAMLILSTVVVLRKDGRWKNPSVLLLVSVFLYVLLLPRFKDYSYILIIAPALVVIRDFMRTNLARFLVVIFVCVNVFAYQPYYAAMLLFIITLAGIRHVPEAYTILPESFPNASNVPSNNSGTILR